MKRILVPLDGSKLSEGILPVAESLVRDHEAELLPLQALSPKAGLDAQVHAQEETEAYLAGMARNLEAHGLIHVRREVWYDHPDRAIADAATF